MENIDDFQVQLYDGIITVSSDNEIALKELYSKLKTVAAGDTGLTRLIDGKFQYNDSKMANAAYNKNEFDMVDLLNELAVKGRQSISGMQTKNPEYVKVKEPDVTPA